VDFENGSTSLTKRFSYAVGMYVYRNNGKCYDHDSFLHLLVLIWGRGCENANHSFHRRLDFSVEVFENRDFQYNFTTDILNLSETRSRSLLACFPLKNIAS